MSTAYGRLVSQLCAGVKKRVYVSPARARLALAGGFPAEAFDKNAHIKPWHIINLVENARAFCFWEGYPELKRPQFLDTDRLLDDYLVFQVAADVKVLPAAYDYSVPKLPLVVDKELVYVGKSSFNIRTRIFVQTSDNVSDKMLHEEELSPSSLTELASSFAQSVAVNMNTRQPEPLPAWWRDKYQEFSQPQLQLTIKPEKEPHGQVVKMYQLRVNHSDIDPYLHANWSASFKYCLDGIFGVANTENNTSLLDRKVKKMEVLFMKEGDFGEWLEVHFWSNMMASDIFHCKIVRAHTADVISYGVVEFYPPDFFESTTKDT